MKSNKTFTTVHVGCTVANMTLSNQTLRNTCKTLELGFDCTCVFIHDLVQDVIPFLSSTYGLGTFLCKNSTYAYMLRPKGGLRPKGS